MRDRGGLRRRLRRWRPRPRWGNLQRTHPFSDRYGFDRGTPVDRALMARFFAQHAELFCGHVLEVGDDTFVRVFRGDRVGAVDIVDIDEENPRATIVADLAAEGSLPAQRYDLVLIAQTLQYIPDTVAALRNCWQAVRPGGTLMVTVPSLSRLDPGVPAGDLWRITPGGLEHMLRTAAPGASLKVCALGNLVAAVAFLEGIAAEELRSVDLATDDPRFPLIAAACASKPAAAS
jgi:SAM-dependent methyltransferase